MADIAIWLKCVSLIVLLLSNSTPSAMWPDRSRLDLRLTLSGRKRQRGGCGETVPDLASPLLGQHSGDGPLSVPLSSAGSAQCGGASGLAAGVVTCLPQPQLRKDAPVRRVYQRGGIPDLSSEVECTALGIAMVRAV